MGTNKMASNHQQHRRKSFSLSELQGNVASSLKTVSSSRKKPETPDATQNRNIAARAMEDLDEEVDDSSNNTSCLGDSSTSSNFMAWPINGEDSSRQSPEEFIVLPESQSAPQSRRTSMEILCKALNNVVSTRRRASMGDIAFGKPLSGSRDQRQAPRRTTVSAVSSDYLAKAEDYSNASKNAFRFPKRDSITNALRDRLEEKKMHIPEAQRGGITELATDDLAELKEIEESHISQESNNESFNSLASLPDDIESMMLLDAGQDIRLVN
mmetsp:Transcript_9279/g.14274  ORF Transcript_9279/g.14274 Transcript_9279/m.14274 type:complete len:269 (+) Transcript_9279:441-1247(+)